MESIDRLISDWRRRVERETTTEEECPFFGEQKDPNGHKDRNINDMNQ